MENAPELKATTTAPAATAGQQTCSVGAGGGSMNRRTLYIGLSIGATAGLLLGWDWLVAVGVASIIIALAPCLIMCAFGMCAMRMCQDKKTEAPANSDPVNTDAPVTKAAADGGRIANTATHGRVVAKTAFPDAAVTSVAAADIAVAKAALESAPSRPASEARA